VTDIREQVAWIIDRFEGGATFTDDPFDRGGATKYGVTQLALRDYRSRLTGNPALTVTAADVRNLERSEALDIGVTVYGVDSGLVFILDPRVRLVALDYAFHSGPVRAIKALQDAVGVTVDGIFGPVSQDAVNRHHNPVQLGTQVLTRRSELMQRLIEADATQRKYTLGWWKRITANQRILAA
jgi:lysozyme family protein